MKMTLKMWYLQKTGQVNDMINDREYISAVNLPSGSKKYIKDEEARQDINTINGFLENTKIESWNVADKGELLENTYVDTEGGGGITHSYEPYFTLIDIKIPAGATTLYFDCTALENQDAGAYSMFFSGSFEGFIPTGKSIAIPNNSTMLYITFPYVDGDYTNKTKGKYYISFDTPTGRYDTITIDGISTNVVPKEVLDDELNGKQDTISDLETIRSNASAGANLFNPTNHNGIYRGKDLTNVYTISQMYDMIHDGSFKDLYLGDYFTKSITTDIYTHFTDSTFDGGTVYYEMSGTINDRTWTETEDAAPQSGKTYATKLTKTENVTLMFAAFDYYYNTGSQNLTAHHAILIPRGPGFSTLAKMNLTNTATGGYLNSDMHQITLPCYAKSLKIALENHLLSHRALLSNAIDASILSMAGAGFTGASSGWEWTATELQLMTEQQVYGTRAWTSSGYDVGIDYRKLPVFDYINPVPLGRDSFWLRSVASSTSFTYCHSSSFANYSGASYVTRVRPLILFG